MFTKKNVESARFINDEHTTIEVLHTIDSDDNLRPYILEYDKDCLNIQALAKAGWDLENITEETIAYKKEASRLYNEEINAAATEMNKTNKPILIANDEVMNKENVAIGGYDAVAYFAQDAATIGSDEFTSNYKSVDWKFSSAENLALFETNPEQYIPAYGGHCSFGACKGAAVPAEPTIWSINDERLFFFSKEDAKKEAQLNFNTIIEIGDENWNN